MGDISNEVEVKYRNYYHCPYCQTKWQDEWDSMCNDKCPECDREIEPYKSEDFRPHIGFSATLYKSKDLSPMPKEINDAVNTIFYWINKMTLEDEVGEEFIKNFMGQHRTLQQNFMRHILVPLINRLAENNKEGWYDARNEETIKACAEMAKILKTKHFPFI